MSDGMYLRPPVKCTGTAPEHEAEACGSAFHNTARRALRLERMSIFFTIVFGEGDADAEITVQNLHIMSKEFPRWKAKSNTQRTEIMERFITKTIPQLKFQVGEQHRSTSGAVRILLAPCLQCEAVSSSDTPHDSNDDTPAGSSRSKRKKANKGQGPKPTSRSTKKRYQKDFKNKVIITAA